MIILAYIVLILIGALFLIGANQHPKTTPREVANGIYIFLFILVAGYIMTR